MDITDLIWFEERRLNTILYRLQKAKRSDRQGRIPNPTNGQLFGLFRQSAHISNVRNRFSVLPDLNRRLGLGQNVTHVTRRIVQILINAVRYEDCTKCVSACDGHCTVNHHVNVCTGPRMDHSETPVTSLRIIKTGDMILFRALYRLLGSRN